MSWSTRSKFEVVGCSERVKSDFRSFQLVYCKDDDRRERYAQEKLDSLGYAFRPRSSKSRKGKHFINFSPAISEKASKAIRRVIRDWKLHVRSDKSLEDLSRMFNPTIRGWIQYYGRFYRSGLYPLRRYLNSVLARWATRKYKKLRHRFRRAEQWLRRVSQHDPQLFAHWQLRTQCGSVMGAV
jgi:RNA-directed DNA polymerase